MTGAGRATVHCVAELRLAYHQRLEDIDVAVKEMITLVEHDIPRAGAAFLDADQKAAEVVGVNEGIVEASYERVEHLVIDQFARQAPVAGELRFLLTVFRILPELSGAHDWAAQLARRGVTGLAAELPSRVRRLIGEIFDAAPECGGRSVRCI
jgi:phosphate uptake regulator